MTPEPLVLGTAGHIDHGKTWLVRALTGKDTDRLPEEQARGISIDLGYAPLELPGGRRLSVVDVPGHERFVRNMVAGATGIDLFLLVVDAGEGARPQTHEHLAIVRLLGIEAGVVAVTKADAVDAEALALVVEEAHELVPRATVVPVSAKTGLGLDELRAALLALADAHERPAARGPTRLFVDRVFTLHGIGTVATGTLWSGSIGAGDQLRVEPAGLDARVRSVQVHDRPVERAAPGQRVAVSLPNVERGRLSRGDALVEPGSYAVGYRLDVALEELERIDDGARLHVHHGTADVPARIVRIGERHVQLRLSRPVVAARGDRFVLRDRTTVGGGTVLDPAPPRRTSAERLRLLEEGDEAAILRAHVREPVRIAELRRSGLFTGDASPSNAGLVSVDGWAFAADWLTNVRSGVHERLRRHAASSPLDPGLPVGEVFPGRPWAAAVVPLLGLVARGGKLYLPGAESSLGDRAEPAERLEAELARSGLDPVPVADRQLAAFLEREGRLVRVGDGLTIGRKAYDLALETLIAECEAAGSIRLARFRDLLGTSRRSAQLLLERFDADGMTRRVGDERVLRRAARR